MATINSKSGISDEKLMDYLLAADRARNDVESMKSIAEDLKKRLDRIENIVEKVREEVLVSKGSNDGSLRVYETRIANLEKDRLSEWKVAGISFTIMSLISGLLIAMAKIFGSKI